MNRIVLAVSFLLLPLVSNFGQTSKFKALFIYNFTKYMNWPVPEQSEAFRINIIGSDDLYNEFSVISKSRKVGSQNIELSKENNPGTDQKYNLIYVDGSNSGKIENLVNQYKGQSTIIITDCKNCLQKNIHINFIVVDNRLGYELNKELIEKENVKISGELLKLANKQ